MAQDHDDDTTPDGSARPRNAPPERQDEGRDEAKGRRGAREAPPHLPPGAMGDWATL